MTSSLPEEELPLTPTTKALLIDEGLAECIPSLVSAGLRRIEDIVDNKVREGDLHVLGIEKPFYQRKLVRLSQDRVDLRARQQQQARQGQGQSQHLGGMQQQRQLVVPLRARSPQQFSDLTLNIRSPTIGSSEGHSNQSGAVGVGYRSSTPSRSARLVGHARHHHSAANNVGSSRHSTPQSPSPAGGAIGRLPSFVHNTVPSGQQQYYNNNHQHLERGSYGGISPPPADVLGGGRMGITPLSGGAGGGQGGVGVEGVGVQYYPHQQRVHHGRTLSSSTVVSIYGPSSVAGGPQFPLGNAQRDGFGAGIGSGGIRGDRGEGNSLSSSRLGGVPPLHTANQQYNYGTNSFVQNANNNLSAAFQERSMRTPTTAAHAAATYFSSSFSGPVGSASTGASPQERAYYGGVGAGAVNGGAPLNSLAAQINAFDELFLASGGGDGGRGEGFGPPPTTPSVRERILRRQRDLASGKRRPTEGGDHILIHVISVKSAPNASYPLSPDCTYKVRVGLAENFEGRIVQREGASITTRPAKGPNPLFLFNDVNPKKSSAGGSSSSGGGGAEAGGGGGGRGEGRGHVDDDTATDDVRGGVFTRAMSASKMKQQESGITNANSNNNNDINGRPHQAGAFGVNFPNGKSGGVGFFGASKGKSSERHATISQHDNFDDDGLPKATYGDETDPSVIKLRTNFMKNCVAFELIEIRPFSLSSIFTKKSGGERVIGYTVFPISFFHKFTADTIADGWYPVHIHTTVAGGGKSGEREPVTETTSIAGIAEGAQPPFTSPASPSSGASPSPTIAAIRLVLEVPGGCPRQVGKAFRVTSVNLNNRFFRIEVFDAIIFQNTDSANKFVESVTDLTSAPPTPARDTSAASGGGGRSNSPSLYSHQQTDKQNVNITLQTKPLEKLYLSLRLTAKKDKTRRRTKVVAGPTYRPVFGEEFSWNGEVSNCKCITIVMKRLDVSGGGGGLVGGLFGGGKGAVVGVAHIPIQFFLSQSFNNTEERMATLVDIHNPLLIRACVHVRLSVGAMSRASDPSRAGTYLSISGVLNGTAIPLYRQHQQAQSLQNHVAFAQRKGVGAEQQTPMPAANAGASFSANNNNINNYSSNVNGGAGGGSQQQHQHFGHLSITSGSGAISPSLPLTPTTATAQRQHQQQYDRTVVGDRTLTFPLPPSTPRSEHSDLFRAGGGKGAGTQPFYGSSGGGGELHNHNAFPSAVAAAAAANFSSPDGYSYNSRAGVTQDKRSGSSPPAASVSTPSFETDHTSLMGPPSGMMAWSLRGGGVHVDVARGGRTAGGANGGTSRLPNATDDQSVRTKGEETAQRALTLFPRGISDDRLTATRSSSSSSISDASSVFSLLIDSDIDGDDGRLSDDLISARKHKKTKNSKTNNKKAVKGNTPPLSPFQSLEGSSSVNYRSRTFRGDQHEERTTTTTITLAHHDSNYDYSGYGRARSYSSGKGVGVGAATRTVSAVTHTASLGFVSATSASASAFSTANASPYESLTIRGPQNRQQTHHHEYHNDATTNTTAATHQVRVPNAGGGGPSPVASGFVAAQTVPVKSGLAAAVPSMPRLSKGSRQNANSLGGINPGDDEEGIDDDSILDVDARLRALRTPSREGLVSSENNNKRELDTTGNNKIKKKINKIKGGSLSISEDDRSSQSLSLFSSSAASSVRSASSVSSSDLSLRGAKNEKSAKPKGGGFSKSKKRVSSNTHEENKNKRENAQRGGGGGGGVAYEGLGRAGEISPPRLMSRPDATMSSVSNDNRREPSSSKLPAFQQQKEHQQKSHKIQPPSSSSPTSTHNSHLPPRRTALLLDDQTGISSGAGSHGPGPSSLPPSSNLSYTAFQNVKTAAAAANRRGAALAAEGTGVFSDPSSIINGRAAEEHPVGEISNNYYTNNNKGGAFSYSVSQPSHANPVGGHANGPAKIRGSEDYSSPFSNTYSSQLSSSSSNGAMPSIMLLAPGGAYTGVTNTFNSSRSQSGTLAPNLASATVAANTSLMVGGGPTNGGGRKKSTSVSYSHSVPDREQLQQFHHRNGFHQHLSKPSLPATTIGNTTGGARERAGGVLAIVGGDDSDEINNIEAHAAATVVSPSIYGLADEGFGSPESLDLKSSASPRAAEDSLFSSLSHGTPRLPQSEAVSPATMNGRSEWSEDYEYDVDL